MKTMRKSKPKHERRDFDQDGDDYVYPTKKVRNQKRNRRHDANLIRNALIPPEDEEDRTLDQEIMDDYNDMINEFNANEDLSQKIEDERDVEYHNAMSDLYDPWDHMDYDDDNHTMPDGPAPF